MSSLDPRNMKRNADAVVAKGMDKLGKAAGFELGRRIMRRTPVDTGRARANWNASIGSPDASTTESTSSMTATARLVSTTAELQLFKGQEFWVTNGLPYIQALEDGHSTQAPRGFMVTGAVSEMKPWLERIGARISREGLNG